MRIFVAGGAGYVGSKLVPELLKAGHEVVVYDLYLYDETTFSELRDEPRLVQIRADVRDIDRVRAALVGCDAVIHLACISNDPSFELNPDLGKSINLDCFEPFVLAAKAAGCKRFIYASSSSVYGVKEEPNVTEDMSLEPLTDYSRFKAECEQILLKHIDDTFIGVIIRPATVCGYAPRQRLDVVVNILTNLAYHTGKIKVMGGSQMRPNIHIDDMVRAYLHFLALPSAQVQGQIFNVGYHNQSVSELGEAVRRIVGKKRPVEVVVEPTNDHRSYRISSEKAASVGFVTQYTIDDAVANLVSAFEQGLLPNSLEDKRYFNLKTLKAMDLQ